ncbi:MAG: plasmid pRiA4b ORF-3 family protein [Pseudonocardiaceae bacterium]
MANTRRAKRKNGAALAAVDGNTPHHGGELAELQEQLAELRKELAAAGAPAEILEALDDSGDVGEVLHRLAEAGILPSPQEALAGLLEGWKSLLKRGADPLSAELCGAEFLGGMRRTAPDEADLPEILAGLIEQVAGAGTPEALAMLRVLAVLGPQQIRAAAAEAADRLVAGGLTDRPWVRELGTPQVGSCFGYVEEQEAREAVAITFAYGRKPHAFVVLIDHGLGGGVKDCFVSDRPDRIRADYQKAVKRYGLDFRDHQPAEARAILEQALAAQPCPAEPDQAEDAEDYLDLLRQRMALLPSGAAAPPAGRAAGKRPAGAATVRTVHQVKITLRGAKPPIWRRLEVPSGITLHDLHHSIQEAFGWDGFHMWVFDTPTGYYGVPDPELEHRSAASRKLVDAVPRAGDSIRYTYDFGDDWEHDILVEDVITAEPGVAYPRCVAGRRACPTEDCGGIWAYDELLAILADPGHPQHADRLEWLGLDSADEFDPADFDLDDVNEALSDLARVLLRR